MTTLGVRHFIGLASLIPFLCLGCKPQGEISTYTVERTRPPREAIVAKDVAADFDRMLTAMLPVGDQVYFFKLVGKSAAIDRHRSEFEAFLADVGTGSPLTWKLPTGWSEKGPSEMRINTMVVPDDAGDLEIAISSLPKSDNWGEFVSSNVNRWLGQLGQGELPRQTILNLTKETKTNAGPATVIELVGIMQNTMAMNPHGNMAGTTEPAQATPPAASTTPPAAGSAEFTLTTPDGWQPGRVSAMRKAAFVIADGDQQAEFTLIDLPASGGAQITDVMANVQRWAAQVGLPVDDKLAGLVEKIEIDSTEGSFVNLVGPEGTNPRQAMLAAMIVRSGKVWFFKLFGAAPLIERETENFRKLVDSVKFK